MAREICHYKAVYDNLETQVENTPFILSVMGSWINELYDDNPARSSSGPLVCYSDPISWILTF